MSAGCAGCIASKVYQLVPVLFLIRAGESTQAFLLIAGEDKVIIELSTNETRMIICGRVDIGAR